MSSSTKSTSTSPTENYKGVRGRSPPPPAPEKNLAEKTAEKAVDLATKVTSRIRRGQTAEKKEKKEKKERTEPQPETV